MSSYRNFSIITITFNNSDELIFTGRSIIDFLQSGSNWIIINGGDSLVDVLEKSGLNEGNISLIEESDKGIYDALNKGLGLIQSEYFMFLHSGDTFMSGAYDSVKGILNKMKSEDLLISLNNCVIGPRSFTSNYWKPFMLHYGCQPPHLPTIYASKYFKGLKYKSNYKIISDFILFYKIFSDGIIEKHQISKDNFFLVNMKTGGLTTGLFSGRLTIFSELIKEFGLFRALFMTLMKYPFKLIFQSFPNYPS